MWLRSPRWDLAWFVAPGLLAVAFVLLLHVLGIVGGPHDELPPWGWLLVVVAVDVAHVYATAYRVYLDPRELERRRALYLGVPAAAWLAGVAVHLVSDALFWTLLAYVAVFHFIRQQEGFVRLYRRRCDEKGRLDLALDRAFVYVATLYPVLFWHAHLPRAFHWFRNRDFAAPDLAPATWQAILAVASVAYASFLAFYVVRAAWRVLSKQAPANPGKWGVLVATWACWFVGIVPFDSDLAFTITNVLLHGVPYIGLIFLVAERKQLGPSESAYDPGTLPARLFARGLVGMSLAFLVLLVVAFLEEGTWDHLVWHEHESIYGAWGQATLDRWALALLVPLLSVPQAAHYILDGIIWKLDGSNPGLDAWLGLSRKPVVVADMNAR